MSDIEVHEHVIVDGPVGKLRMLFLTTMLSLLTGI